MVNGTVKMFNEERGFGFIQQENGEDVFVHYSAINTSGRQSLRPGDRVQFEIERDPKGMRAAKVQVLS